MSVPTATWKFLAVEIPLILFRLGQQDPVTNVPGWAVAGLVGWWVSIAEKVPGSGNSRMPVYPGARMPVDGPELLLGFGGEKSHIFWEKNAARSGLAGGKRR